ncbi:MAG: endonuclease/exonuclease/phosphatase family protein [Myxococcus sp.]|nr:endonuclease/exonuclease/phosphatase family protein [Myxococcus sp.]
MTRTWLLALTASLLSHVALAEGPLKLMAFNVLFTGSDDAASVKAIETESPEVVCLTELTPHFVKAFEGALSKTYPYRAFVPQAGTWGVGFASKRPLADVRTGPVAPSKLPAMEARVQFDGRSVQLVCVHLMPPGGKHQKSDTFFDALEKNAVVRKKQAQTLVTRFEKTERPVVLLGDFNEEPNGEGLRALEAAGFTRGCALSKSSCTATFPGPVFAWPAVFNIDHVFARGLTFTEAKTVRAGGSDHYPVTATLVSTQPRATTAK